MNIKTILLLTSTVKEVFDLDFKTFIIDLILIILAIVVIAEAVGKLSKIIGKPVKWVKKNDEDHNAVVTMKDDIEGLQKDFRDLKNMHVSGVSGTRDEVMSLRDEVFEKIDSLHSDVSDLKDMVIEDRIARMRATILDTASAIYNRQTVSLEQYQETIKVHDSYEKFLKSRNESNGQVDNSMEIINKHYQALLEAGPNSKNVRTYNPSKKKSSKIVDLKSDVLEN